MHKFVRCDKTTDYRKTVIIEIIEGINFSNNRNCWNNCSASNLHLGDTQFEYQSEHRAASLRYSMVFLTPSKQYHKSIISFNISNSHSLTTLSLDSMWFKLLIPSLHISLTNHNNYNNDRDQSRSSNKLTSFVTCKCLKYKTQNVKVQGQHMENGMECKCSSLFLQIW